MEFNTIKLFPHHKKLLKFVAFKLGSFWVKFIVISGILFFFVMAFLIFLFFEKNGKLNGT